MLKSELIRPRITVTGQTVTPKHLPADYHWLGVATQLIALFQTHLGQTRGQLADALRAYEGDNLDYPIIRGLASVLENRATFEREPPLDPVALREFLFAAGPATNGKTLFRRASRVERVAEAAAHFEISPQQVESALFADLAEEQILQATDPAMTPRSLVDRYNLEVARGLLYWAREVRLHVEDGYKDLFKFIKLFKLMHTIRPAVAGYDVTLHGPISPFVASTIRYGLQFAKFMPALLLCEQWRMEADVRPPGSERLLRYTLDDSTALHSHFKSSGEFDSQLEADFAREFEEKYTRTERKWELAREDEIIIVDDTVIIPDFSLTHRQEGRRALIEIVGFWHPRYLQRKLEKVRAAERRDLILLVYESANVAADEFEAAAAGEVLRFVNKPILKDVLAAAERCAL